ncbi:hypothetical protein P4O66_002972 [Electrophorus voltai]|uniref:Uncharacterized protein n=1 Tax=Electrophorus voltai TaxID=2609070 RepID=A0AAD8YVB2_9TELE|nr:hypothetical protein P4O66_002972 [Electrophorus voltai]
MSELRKQPQHRVPVPLSSPRSGPETPGCAEAQQGRQNWLATPMSFLPDPFVDSRGDVETPTHYSSNYTLLNSRHCGALHSASLGWGRMASCWPRAVGVRWFLLMLLWSWVPLGPLTLILTVAERLEQATSPFSAGASRSGSQLDWLLSEKGPFHRCPEYAEFKERFQQGFSTRYKIYSLCSDDDGEPGVRCMAVARPASVGGLWPFRSLSPPPACVQASSSKAQRGPSAWACDA